MTVTVYFSAVVGLIGLLLWLCVSNQKLAEIGKIMFFCGLLAFCFQTGSKTWSGSTP